MTVLAYDPSPKADDALRLIAQLAYNMPDGETPAACCPLVEDLGGESVVQELLTNKMVREFRHQDHPNGIRVGMTDIGLRFIEAKLNSGQYQIENSHMSNDEGWAEFRMP